MSSMNPMNAPKQPIIMLDLETLGLSAASPILQIGAVNIFAPYKDFNEYVYAASSEQRYAMEEAEVLEWWGKQDPQLRAKVFSGTVYIKDALHSFANWFPKGALITSLGSNLDVACLEYHFRYWKIPVPWHYRNVRCFRTNLARIPDAKLHRVQPLIPHDALSDAQAQAESFRILSEIYPSILW